MDLGRIVSNMIGNLGKEVSLGLAVPLDKDFLPKLVTKATGFVLGKFQRKRSGKGAVRVGEIFTIFIWNEDMDYRSINWWCN